MASSSWNSPFRMSKAEKDHLNANKQKKKDLESRLDQVNFDLQAIKTVLSKLAVDVKGETIAGDIFKEAVVETSCNNIFKHHTDMVADAVRKVNSMLSRKDMIDIEISVSGVDNKGNIFPEALHDKFTVQKISDRGDHFFAVNINYYTNDEHPYMGIDIYNVLSLEDENKFSIELYGQDAYDAVLKEQWMLELERILLSSQTEFSRLHFYLYIRKTDSKYTVYGNVHVYGQDDKFITSLNIPIKTVSDTIAIIWKKENILKKYAGISN